MPLLIVRNDITDMKADAIVNTANPLPLVGSGVDRAIYKKAGWMELLKLRREIGNLAVGEAAVTPGLNLPAKHIIHVVGPRWRGGNNNEAQKLEACYRKILDTAIELECESVAIPLISTGNFRFPKDLALRIARQVITEYIEANELLVYLVVYDEESFQISSELFDDVKSYIEQKLEHRPMFKYCITESRSIEECLNKTVCMDAALPQAKPRKVAQRSLADLVKEVEISFAESLFKHIDRKGLTDPQVYKRANLSRKLFSRIRTNKDYKPSKNTALALAIALELNLDETKDFIGKAGFALTHSSVQDIIVEYYIEMGRYNIMELNEALFVFDQQLLGQNVA